MKSWIALAAVAVLLAALPLVGSNYLLRMATTVCMYAVMAHPDLAQRISGEWGDWWRCASRRE